MFLLLATLCYTFGPLVKKAPKQAAAAAVVDSGGVFIFLTCMGNPGSWEVKSWNGKNVGLLRLVKVFFATKHVFFSCICYWIIFGEIELSWMGLYDTWIILQMDEVRKMIIYIYIYWYVTLRWLCILGKGILAEYHQKIHFVLLVVRQVWRLSLNTQRYHQRLHCGVVWLLRSRAGEDGGALRYMLPMKATCVGGGP